MDSPADSPAVSPDGAVADQEADGNNAGGIKGLGFVMVLSFFGLLL